jgi:ribonuclease HII
MVETLSHLLEFDSAYSKSFKDHLLIGVDEVGRGALAGPVIACAFSWNKKIDKMASDNSSDLLELNLLNDSKQINKLKREDLFKLLVKHGQFGIGYGSVLEIEKFNILNATFLAMKRAYENLMSKIKLKNKEPYLLIDGNKFNPYINSRQSFIVGGDAKSSLIAGASIIAKVYRDELMTRLSLSKKFKKYNWGKNSAYGTESHRKTIKKHGVTPLHRKLFVRKVLGIT